MPVEPDKIKALFLAALEKNTSAERAAFLDPACAGDVALRQRVEDLLLAHDQPDSLLDRSAAQHLGADSPAGPADEVEALAFLPEWLAAVVGRLHARQPSERFQSSTEVAELLKSHLARLQQP